ncbi:MAG: type II secretion system protein GspJ [Candidatus Omnitrophota bacterium]
MQTKAAMEHVINRDRCSFLRGITFIELLVAVTIFVAVITACISAFNQGFLVQKLLKKNVFVFQQGWEVLDLMENEVQNCIFFLPPSFLGTGEQIDFFSLVEIPDVENITTRQNIPKKVNKIRYYLKDKENTGSLYRRRTVYDEEMVEDTDEEEILQGFSSIQFQFYGRKADGLDWFDEWQDTDQLPRMVKVTLNMQGESLEKNIFLPQGTQSK